MYNSIRHEASLSFALPIASISSSSSIAVSFSSGFSSLLDRPLNLLLSSASSSQEQLRIARPTSKHDNKQPPQLRRSCLLLLYIYIYTIYILNNGRRKKGSPAHSYYLLRLLDLHYSLQPWRTQFPRYKSSSQETSRWRNQQPRQQKKTLQQKRPRRKRRTKNQGTRRHSHQPNPKSTASRRFSSSMHRSAPQHSTLAGQRNGITS